MDSVDCLVVGAGVVGLAIARALARAGREVIVAEAEPAIGMGTSSRNSEVIHAGIYYPPGSLKARYCIEGKARLYAFCESHGVPYRRLGKLIVAASAPELDKLDEIRERAIASGVVDLAALSAAEVTAMEPALVSVGGLLSPSTGIIDSHAYMLALQGEAEAHGAVFALSCPLIGGETTFDGTILRFGGADPFTIKARQLVNAAGLHAHRVAAAIEGVPSESVPQVSYAKGNYFGLTGRAPFTHLVYPVPEPGGLGVHVTLDMAGRVRFGPDVEWIDAIDYEVDPARAQPFYAAIRRYWPALPDGALFPDYAGIRVKLHDQPASDFEIRHLPDLGIVSLFGIESPGLTSSLAIAADVEALLAG